MDRMDATTAPSPVATATRPASESAAATTAPSTKRSAEGAVASSPAKKKQRGHRKVPKQHRVGNFRSYYHYRLGQEPHDAARPSDPRLSVLQREWFAGKRGLDVGCNSGDLTIAIGKLFAPSYILGVDVDPQLVATARGNLKEIMQKQQVEDAFHAITHEDGAGEIPETKNEASSAPRGDGKVIKPGNAIVPDAEAEPTNGFGQDMPLSFRLWKPPVQNKDKIPKALGKAALSTTFPYNVVFKREDVAKDAHAGKDYDFITCFSVTKWIHLFHGDEGIKRVFRHFYDLLAPGGRLVLEPQPWKSYHKRKFTSDVTSANYGKIELRPKDFPTFLTESVGFKSCTFLQVCQTSSKGFKRPIYVVEK